jgi:hypothetical protein
MENTGILTVLHGLGFLLWYVCTFVMLNGFGGVIVYLRMPWLIKEAGYD